MNTEESNYHPKYGNVKSCSRHSNGCKRTVDIKRRCRKWIINNGPGYGITGCWFKNGHYCWYSHHVKFFKGQASRKIRRTADISNGCNYKKVYNYGNVVY